MLKSPLFWKMTTLFGAVLLLLIRYSCDRALYGTGRG